MRKKSKGQSDRQQQHQAILSDLAEYSVQTKILGAALVGVCIFALGRAFYGSYFYSFLQVTILFASLVIAALSNQYRFQIPGTKLTISPRKFFVFWGTIWLGAAGGVLLSATASAARYRTTRNKVQWGFGFLIHIAATFAAAETFYFVLRRLAGFADWRLAGEAVNAGWFLVAAAMMALTHYLIATLLSAVLLRFESEYIFREVWRRNYARTSGNYLAALAAALVFHLAFRHFGVEFGLVILPLAVGAHLAYKIHLQRLAQKTREITEASRIHLATVEALATAIDARDQMGLGHVRRTQIYAVGIGEILGLSERELHALRTGALLHDIGKLAVPDHILNKPGRLTPAETEKMKIHASVGASILEKIPFDAPVVPTIKHHHESWDGSGYPQGLKGENIPLTARILAIADTYDTLRSARPYRAAVSRDEARKVLLGSAGTRFDPKLVDIFLRNLRHFEAEIAAQGIAHNFADEEAGLFGIGAAPTTQEAGAAGGADHHNYVEQIKRANREVFTLYELARDFSASLNLDDTLALFVEKISGLVPFDTCLVYLLESGQAETAKAVYAEGENSDALKGRRVKFGQGATGYALKMKQAVHNVNPALDFSFSAHEFTREYTTLISLPLVADGRLVGAVSMYSCELENYEDEHLRLLETVSRIAADAIAKSLQHAETESRALTDPMTGLPNARCLQIQFEKEVARARRNGSEFQLLMLDLDGFKAVNDTFGHKTGDALLREISKVMRAQLRDYDFLARYAGDEFVVILPEMSGEGVRELCERMEKAVCDFALPVGDDRDGGGGGRFARVGVSLGAACYPQAGETLDQIIVAADQAMYAVKAQHKRTMRASDHRRPPARSELPVSASPSAKPIFTADAPSHVSADSVIMELDESHIISSAAVN